jgi:hypothetical protein
MSTPFNLEPQATHSPTRSPETALRNSEKAVSVPRVPVVTWLRTVQVSGLPRAGALLRALSPLEESAWLRWNSYREGFHVVNYEEADFTPAMMYEEKQP